MDKYVVGLGQHAIDEYYDLDQYPESGNKTLIFNRNEFIGGMVLNVLSNLSVYGVKTFYIDRLPTVDLEPTLYDELNRYKINYDFSVQLKVKSNRCLIMNHGSERTIFIHEEQKPNLFLSKEQINLISNATYFYTLLGDILQIENIDAVLPDVINNIVLDIESLSELNQQIIQILAKAKVIFLNEFGCVDFKTHFGVLKPLHENQIIVVTKGSEGATLYHQDQQYNVSANKVDVKDTTGAGDLFNALVLRGLLENHSFDHILNEANDICSKFIQQVGPKLTKII
jgi:ribokinase